MNHCKLFVGNLTYSVREGQLKALFSRFGEVVSVRILEKKGYGFVEMSTPEQAKSARESLSETEFEGRNLLIDSVRPFIKPKKSHGRPGSGGSGGRPPARSGSTTGKTGSGYGYRGKNPTRQPAHGSGRSSSSRPQSGRPSMPPRRNAGSAPRRR